MLAASARVKALHRTPSGLIAGGSVGEAGDQKPAYWLKTLLANPQLKPPGGAIRKFDVTKITQADRDGFTSQVTLRGTVERIAVEKSPGLVRSEIIFKGVKQKDFEIFTMDPYLFANLEGKTIEVTQHAGILPNVRMQLYRESEIRVVDASEPLNDPGPQDPWMPTALPKPKPRDTGGDPVAAVYSFEQRRAWQVMTNGPEKSLIGAVSVPPSDLSKPAFIQISQFSLASGKMKPLATVSSGSLLPKLPYDPLQLSSIVYRDGWIYIAGSDNEGSPIFKVKSDGTAFTVLLSADQGYSYGPAFSLGFSRSGSLLAACQSALLNFSGAAPQVVAKVFRGDKALIDDRGDVFYVKDSATKRGYVQVMRVDVASGAQTAVLDLLDKQIPGSVAQLMMGPGGSIYGWMRPFPYPALVALLRFERDGSKFTTLYRFADNRNAPVNGRVAVGNDGWVYGINGQHGAFSIGADGVFREIVNLPAGADSDQNAVRMDFMPFLLPAADGNLYAVNGRPDDGVQSLCRVSAQSPSSAPRKTTPPPANPK